MSALLKTINTDAFDYLVCIEKTMTRLSVADTSKQWSIEDIEEYARKFCPKTRLTYATSRRYDSKEGFFIED